jgi:hypothetical protein
MQQDFALCSKQNLSPSPNKNRISLSKSDTSSQSYKAVKVSTFSLKIHLMTAVNQTLYSQIDMSAEAYPLSAAASKSFRIKKSKWSAT